MRSCCRSVCFLLLMDSKIPPLVDRAWRPIRRVVPFGPWCINRLVFQKLGDLLVEVESPKQAKDISNLKSLSTIPATVKPHATLNSSKGVISCGELLNESEEKITEELQSQGVIHVCRITIRRDGQLLNTNHLMLTFDSNKLSENIKAGYMRLSVRAYIPNPLRCFKCQRFGHSKTSFRGTLTCARFAEVGHEKKKLKKDSPSKTNSISTAEKILKFYTTSLSKVTNPIPTKDNISSHKSTFKPLETTKRTTVDIDLLPMAVFPPLEKRILQTRESDADAEMSSSSLSEEDALEYNMSGDLENSPAVTSPPPSSKPEKANNYKNR
ncbi:hypothetical protein AVEN_204336-1 [Araneus ventricosus]|uniref:Uncharacterized protein n=1 Tax=Araneus ventricosus TaxID=182803 RepID=A0A4Y2PT35_ARAVE|nr:hypothetical protein AVEN_204336-1 [Araneus ventricosus]